MREKIKNENGMVIIEAAYVFPIMIFVIFFLIYMGNAFYLKASLDSIVSNAAVKGAARCADPCLVTGTLNTSADKNLYRYFFSGYMKEVEGAIDKDVRQTIESNGTFFAGMIAEIDSCEVKYTFNLLEPHFSVKVKYSIKFPIRFIFTDDDTILAIESKADAPLADIGEFIQIIDMFEDYYENSGAKDKVDEVIGKLKGGIKAAKGGK